MIKDFDALLTEEDKALQELKKKRINRKKSIWDWFRKIYAKYKIWKMKKDDPFIYEE